MGFNAYVRQVRDRGLRYERRVHALRCCVERYQPIGFQAGLSFLRKVAGPFEKDEAALLRAISRLIASRDLWHAEIRAYTRKRQAAKLRGERSPHPDEPNPSNRPLCWYGSARPAALHALQLQHNLPATSDLAVLAAASLAADGHLKPDQHARLLEILNDLRQWAGTSEWRTARLIRMAAEAR